MRLDEQARRIERDGAAPVAASLAAGAADAELLTLPPPVLVGGPPARARFSEDPGAWARDHWPVLTAVGAVLGTALVLSLTL